MDDDEYFVATTIEILCARTDDLLSRVNGGRLPTLEERLTRA